MATDEELNKIYSNGLLPSSPPGASDRDANGILKSTTVDMIVKSLKRTGTIPALTNSDDYDTFVKKQETLLKNIKDEYEFYESRYKTALNNLFNTIREGYINNTGDIQFIIQSNLAIVQTLNKKLNDLTQIINGVTEDMLASTTGLEEQIKEFDRRNKEHQRKLQEQNQIITSSQATTELNKRMVKYTEQKAKYSNNLLGLYSFLNVVALGLLVYVYKSSSE
jgi:uncharacterized protein YoxC